MRISKSKQDKISEQVLGVLFLSAPKPLFISQIALEIARDEEFVKKILFELKQKKIVSHVTKNPEGKPYIRRSRWKLTDEAYELYKKAQHSIRK